MQFITHRDPVAESGWSTALGATGDAVSNVLGIYANYKNQQLEQKRYDREQQRLNEAERMRREQFASDQAQRDVQNQIWASEKEREDLEKGLPGARPVIDTGVDILPTRKIEMDPSNPMAVKSVANPQTDPNKPLEHWKEAAPTETRTTRRVVDPRTGAVLRDAQSLTVRYEDEIRAQREQEARKTAVENAIATGQMVRLTPEQRAMVQEHAKTRPGLALYANSDAVPTDIARMLDPEKPVTAEVDGSLYERDSTSGEYKLKIRGTDKTAAAETRQLTRQENALRAEFNRESRKTREGITNLDRFSSPVKKSLESGKRPTATDEFALIYAFNKALDPNSVVRESEFKNSKSVGAGIADRAFLLLQNWHNGKQLTDGQIAEMMDTIGRARESSVTALQDMSREYRGLALNYGIDPSRVLTLGAEEEESDSGDALGILGDNERTLGAPGAKATTTAPAAPPAVRPPAPTSTFGLPQVRVDANSLRRR